MPRYLLIASDHLPGVHPSAEDLFRGAYDSLNSQADCRPKMSTRDYMMDYVQKLPDYHRVFKDDADAIAQCNAWLEKPPYQLFGPNLGELNMTKELLQAAKKRVNAGALPLDELGDINNKDLQDQIRLLASGDFVELTSIGADAYNEPDTGSSGADLHFKGKANGTMEYGTKVLDAKGIAGLAAWVKATEAKVSGASFELMTGEGGGFSMTVIADAD
jgi:hypothetical protein